MFVLGDSFGCVPSTQLGTRVSVALQCKRAAPLVYSQFCVIEADVENKRCGEVHREGQKQRECLFRLISFHISSSLPFFSTALSPPLPSSSSFLVAALWGKYCQPLFTSQIETCNAGMGRKVARVLLLKRQGCESEGLGRTAGLCGGIIAGT